MSHSTASPVVLSDDNNNKSIFARIGCRVSNTSCNSIKCVRLSMKRMQIESKENQIACREITFDIEFNNLVKKQATSDAKQKCINKAKMDIKKLKQEICILRKEIDYIHNNNNKTKEVKSVKSRQNTVPATKTTITSTKAETTSLQVTVLPNMEETAVQNNKTTTTTTTSSTTMKAAVCSSSSKPVIEPTKPRKKKERKTTTKPNNNRADATVVLTSTSQKVKTITSIKAVILLKEIATIQKKSNKTITGPQKEKKLKYRNRLF